MSRTSTRGVWLDTRDGTVYEGNLRHAILASGGTKPDYYRCWLALRKCRPWPADVPIRPASRLEVISAQRTTIYEVEMILPEANAHAVQEMLLNAGAWVRRVSWKRLPTRVRKPGFRRCVWLISGLVDYGWLQKMVEASEVGYFREASEEQYRVVFRGQQQPS